mmetsp:Transcript_37388/g.71634  ORF Transcript_37388/g.71634 Transcript_37388/m.71634 type:complete len:304 (-) Transcript_37388:463-1374(-)
MLDILKWLIIIMACLAVTYLLLLYVLQEKFVYVPIIPGMPREYPFVPSRFGLWYEDVKLVAKDGTKIHGWLVKPAGDPKPLGPTVLFLQENAGNIAHRMQNVMCMIKKLHCNVFLLSYRGYGESEGSPSEAGIKQDAQAALDHLLQRKDIDTNALVVFGRSLGGAVASWLASVNPTTVKAVILENTFLSIPALAPALLPFIGFVIGHGSKPLNFIIKSSWRGIDFVQDVLQPVLYLSAGRDEMVPQWHMRELYKHGRSPRCEWVDFPEGRHMDMWTSRECQEQYWPTVYHFLRKNGCYQPNRS